MLAAELRRRMRRIAVDRPARDDVVERDNMVLGLVSGAPGMAVWAIGCATGVFAHGHIRRGAGLMRSGDRWERPFRRRSTAIIARNEPIYHTPGKSFRQSPDVAARAMIHESSHRLVESTRRESQILRDRR